MSERTDRTIRIGGRAVGDGHPTYVVAEVGQNHNGNVNLALELIEAAADAGADSVKFQVGNPREYVNPALWDRPRETPWGVLPYIEYRERLHLSPEALRRTQAHAHAHGLDWFASPLEPSAVDLLEAMDVPCYKVASPMLTHGPLLERIRSTGKPVIVSTGMSTEDEIQASHGALAGTELAILHCTSAYPTHPTEVNLAMIPALRSQFPGVPIGFSDHTVGVPVSVAAVALGASIVERHVTLSRAMWGSDHAASLEPNGLRTMVRYIRTVEEARGDGVKRVYQSERANREKFRERETETV